MAKKLASVGLIPKPEAKAAATLGPFLDDFVERRIDVKPATKEVWSQVVRNLLEHFGADRDLADVTEADAEDFKMFLVGQKLAPTTVHKRLQFARMFFRAAKKRKLIADNPFAEVTAKAAMKPGRERFITREETTRLLDACPNLDWRVIVSLCRYAGMRSPSEVLSLKWTFAKWPPLPLGEGWGEGCLPKNALPGLCILAKPSPPAPLPEGEGRFNSHFAKVQLEVGEHRLGEGSHPGLLAKNRTPCGQREPGATAVSRVTSRAAGGRRGGPRGRGVCRGRRVPGGGEHARRFEELQPADPVRPDRQARWAGALAPAIPRPEGIPGDGACGGIPDPRRDELAGQHPPDRHEALPDGDRRRLSEGGEGTARERRTKRRTGGAECGAEGTRREWRGIARTERNPLRVRWFCGSVRDATCWYERT